MQYTDSKISLKDYLILSPWSVLVRHEYDFSDGIRGKYVERYAEGSNVVVLSPDVAKVFPNSEYVNAALRKLIELAELTRKAS